MSRQSRNWFRTLHRVAGLIGILAMPSYGMADMPDDTDRSVFVFGGGITDADMWKSANPLGVGYEHGIAGLGYQFFPGRIGSVKLGLEAGLAGRLGSGSNAEIWGGVVGRWDGFEVGAVRVSPSFTFGLSHVTRTMSGREEKNERERNGDASTLFYLGPELSFTVASMPDIDFFWRLHHRSGAWGTLGGMHGGSNANVIGVRVNF